MFENTKDFYPTPYNLIEKMLSTVNFYMIKSILEPSAGKGDIVDAIRKKTAPQSRWDQEPRLDIDCIEINSDLRHILTGKVNITGTFTPLVRIEETIVPD